ncbi:tubulin epsilon and delta complex protein 1 isoform 3-T6 [Mantella aurantiaca]
MKRGSNIKDALCALCRLLSFCGCVLDPETFRKAKFNRPEAASAFWKLLYCLLQQICSNDLSSISRNEKRIEGNEFKYVKSILQIQGYGRPAFYELPDDGTEGSREALLAFSWLIYTGKILETILEKKRVKLGDHITFCMIHLYTQGCQIDQRAHHLSAMEIELARYPESCNAILPCLKYVGSFLESYLEWRHLETVYWQWMETVFQSALEDECTTSVHNEINLYTSFPRELKTLSNLFRIKALHKSFSDVHGQFQELLKHHKLASREQIKELERYVKEKEYSLSIKQIKQEVRQKTEHLKHQNEQVSHSHGLLRVVFKECKFKEAMHKDFHLKNIHATDLTKMLQASATKLETEFQNLQDDSRKKLDEKMTEKLEGIVCIPPAKC